MKQENDEPAMIIKPYPTYLHIQSNLYEQKLPYNDITNKFIHYLNINKIPPQLQENIKNINVQIVRNENEKYMVNLTSENEHVLNLDPDVKVYHQEKMKHYNQAKYDFIVFKQREHKKKMINFINEVRAQKFESSVTVFEGRSKKCQRFMILYRAVEESVENIFDLTGKNNISLKELKSGKTYGKTKEKMLNNIIPNFGVQTNENTNTEYLIENNTVDNELYGNFNAMNIDIESVIPKKIVEKTDVYHFITIFLINTDKFHCVIRYGDKKGTHNNGFMIKQTVTKNIEEYFEKLKSSYLHLGYQVNKEISYQPSYAKKHNTKDIYSRIHESPNIDFRRSGSYEKNIHLVGRPQIRNNNSANYSHMHTRFVHEPMGIQRDHNNNPRLPHKNYYRETQHAMLNRQDFEKPFSPRQNDNNYKSTNSPQGYTMQNSERIRHTGPIQHKVYNHPYITNPQSMPRNIPNAYIQNSHEPAFQKSPSMMHSGPRLKQVYSRMPYYSRPQQPNQQQIGIPPNISNNPYHGLAQNNPGANFIPNHSINPSTLYEVPRAKINPSHSSNVYIKPSRSPTEENNKKQRKEETQDMPDFF